MLTLISWPIMIVGIMMVLKSVIPHGSAALSSGPSVVFMSGIVGIFIATALSFYLLGKNAGAAKFGIGFNSFFISVSAIIWFIL